MASKKSHERRPGPPSRRTQTDTNKQKETNNTQNRSSSWAIALRRTVQHARALTISPAARSPASGEWGRRVQLRRVFSSLSFFRGNSHLTEIKPPTSPTLADSGQPEAVTSKEGNQRRYTPLRPFPESLAISFTFLFFFLARSRPAGAKETNTSSPSLNSNKEERPVPFTQHQSLHWPVIFPKSFSLSFSPSPYPTRERGHAAASSAKTSSGGASPLLPSFSSDRTAPFERKK